MIRHSRAIVTQRFHLRPIQNAFDGDPVNTGVCHTLVAEAVHSDPPGDETVTW